MIEPARRYRPDYKFLSKALLMTLATVSLFIPFSLQYFEFIHSESVFVPLLELQATQHRVIFSLVIILASFIMCSHDACVFLDCFDDPNLIPQYTQTLSLFIISFSRYSGIFQLFILIFSYNDKITHSVVIGCIALGQYLNITASSIN